MCDHPNDAFPFLANYPVDVAYSGTGKLNGWPTVCGGWGPDGFDSKCRAYVEGSNNWTEIATLPQGVLYMGYAQADENTMILAGKAFMESIQFREYCRI